MQAQTAMTKKRYVFLILILGSLTALGPFSIDMYLPGFPAIAKSFHTTTSEVALSLSSFFVGLAAGQLLYGPLMDRYGRKRPLYWGLSLYIIASVGCFLSGSIETLVVLRFVQAIGACAAGVASMAMVRDIFPVEDNAKVFALLILILGASPMIAPTVGGYLTDVFGWQSVFVVLLGIAVLILIAVIFALPESYQPDTSYSLKPGPIVGSFLSVIKEPQFYTYAITGAIAFSGLFAYVSDSPIIFMDIFHVDKKVFGWIFALLSIGFIGSSQLNNLLMKYFKSEQIVYAALIWQLAAASAFLVGSCYGLLGMPGTIVLIFCILCGVGVTNPNAAALSLAPFSKNAGTASSLMGTLQLGIGALTSTVVSMFTARSTVPVAALIAGASVLALLTLLIGRRNIVHKVEAVVQPGAGAH